MESFLNLLWAAMSVVALGLWRWHAASAERDRRREPLREWTAIACALVLLFFAISLTDDLNAEVLFLDDCYAAARRHSGCVAGPQHSPNSGTVVHSYGVAPASRSEIFAPLLAVAKVLPVTQQARLIELPVHLAVRAPPTIGL